MTFESANICSKLLTLGAGETTLLSRTGKPREFAPGVRRGGAGLVAEANEIAIYSRDYSDQYRNVFVSVQKHFFLETSVWTWIIRT
jgi:hypothetical protein